MSLRSSDCWLRIIGIALALTVVTSYTTADDRLPPPLPETDTFFSMTLPLPEPIAVAPSSPARLPQVVPRGEPAMTLEAIESVALAQHPAVLNTVANLQASRGKWVQVGLRPNPTIGYLGTEIGNDRQAGFQGGYFQQTFIRGNKLQLSRAVAAREIAQQEQAVVAAELQVLTELRVAFYELLVLQERNRILNRLVNISRQAEQTALQLVRAQESPKTDHLQASIELERFRMDLRSTTIAQQRGLRNLVTRAGIQQADWQQVDGSIQPIPKALEWEPTLDEILATHPRIVMAVANVERARWQVVRERAEPVPNLQTQFAVQHDDATDLVVPSVQAGLVIPLHNRNQGAIARAQADLRGAGHQLNQLRLSLSRRSAELFADYESAKQRVETYETSILPQASETQTLIADAYRHGETEFLVYLTAQRTFFQSTLDYLDALESLWTSHWRVLGMMPAQSLP